MTRPIVPVILAICAAGSAAALDHEFAYAPLVVGAAPGSTSEYHLGFDADMKSKLTDDYRVVADDTTMGLNGTFRAYGIGLSLDTDWAIGQSTDYSRTNSDGSFHQNNPGELLRTELTLDWAIEIRDPRDAKIPLLQIIPHFSWITYPNQRDVYNDATGYENYLKDKQKWLGADLWWALPVEGVELGLGFEQALSTQWRAFRGGIGGREFIQYNSVDLSFWQLVNFGDSEYRKFVAGEEKSGLDAGVLGGRATLPMMFEDLYGFVQIEASYWLDSETRDYNRETNGQDNGDVVLSFGINWLPK